MRRQIDRPRPTPVGLVLTNGAKMSRPRRAGRPGPLSATRTVTQHVENGILRIEARCETLLPCDADITLTVPRGLPVDVRTGEGDVRVEGLDSDLSIEVGDGNVRAEGLLGATVRVQAGWGDARLSFAARPAEVSVGVGVGDVVVTVPEGGYFVSFDTRKGLAKAVVKLADDAGVKLTPAGATFPYGKDPDDRNIRIAPSFPSLADINKAMEVFVVCVKLASVKQKLGV